MASVDAEQLEVVGGGRPLDQLRAAPPQVSFGTNKIEVANPRRSSSRANKTGAAITTPVVPNAMLKTDRAVIRCFTNTDYDLATEAPCGLVRVHCQRRQHDLDAAIRSIHARQHDGGARVRLSKAPAGQGQSGHTKTHCRRNPGGVPEGADFLRRTDRCRSQNCKQQPLAGTLLAEGLGRLIVHGFCRSFWLRIAPPIARSRCGRGKRTPDNFS